MFGKWATGLRANGEPHGLGRLPYGRRSSRSLGSDAHGLSSTHQLIRRYRLLRTGLSSRHPAKKLTGRSAVRSLIRRGVSG